MSTRANVTTRKRRATIYCGFPGEEKGMKFTVDVDNAKKPVTVRGTPESAMRGLPGLTVGCAMSDTCKLKRNQNEFPHPVHMVAVTRNTIFVVDKLDANGKPTHAVRYKHPFKEIVDLNDSGELKKHPDLLKRTFTFNAPYQSKGGPRKSRRTVRKRTRAKSEHKVPRGAMRRAVNAGVINPAVVRQLNLKTIDWYRSKAA